MDLSGLASHHGKPRRATGHFGKIAARNRIKPLNTQRFSTRTTRVIAALSDSAVIFYR
jgi:hypothetical protein